MNPSVNSPVRAADTALQRRLIDGDGAALGAVYDIHAAVLFRIALRVTRDVSTAEDVTQDVLVALWKQPDRFDPARGSLRTYLSMMAHRRSVDFVRANEARKAREDRKAHQDDLTTKHPSAEHHALAEVESQAARSSLSCLPVEQRQCLELAYLGGLSFREVATQLGIPEGTAKSRIRLGLQRLRAVMSAHPGISGLGAGELWS